MFETFCFSDPTPFPLLMVEYKSANQMKKKIMSSPLSTIPNRKNGQK